jgi:hypothetical protein
VALSARRTGNSIECWSTSNLRSRSHTRRSSPFLSDPQRKIQKDLDIQEYTDPTHNPMIPHTFVLEPGLIIHSVYNGYWYWGRPGPEDLRRDLREVTMKVRKDWDLGKPGLREAWDRGDKSEFWPYGRSLREVFKKSA